MNAPAFIVASSFPAALLPSPAFDRSQDAEDEYPALLNTAEHAEVEEALALTDLGITCFNCCFGASFQRSGQFWCSAECWQDVMNGGCDYWYDG